MRPRGDCLQAPPLVPALGYATLQVTSSNCAFEITFRSWLCAGLAKPRPPSVHKGDGQTAVRPASPMSSCTMLEPAYLRTSSIQCGTDRKELLLVMS